MSLTVVMCGLGIHVSPGNIEQVFEKAMEELAQRYNMDWTISYESHVKKVAVMVSKEPHWFVIAPARPSSSR